MRTIFLPVEIHDEPIRPGDRGVYLLILAGLAFFFSAMFHAAGYF